MENRPTVDLLIEKHAVGHPDKVCLIDGSVRMTYREAADNVRSLAEDLMAIGLKKGDVIAVQLPNWRATLLINLAAARIGAITALISIAYRSAEMDRILDLVRPKAVAVPRGFKGVDFVGLVTAASLQTELICLEVERNAELQIRIAPSRIVERDSTGTSVSDLVRPGIDDPMAVFFTSGTEGEPKGALHTHRSLLHMATVLTGGMGLCANDIGLVAAPMTAIAGIPAACLPILSKGGTLVLQESFDPEATLRLIQEERISYLPASPAHLAMMLSLPSFDAYDLSSVRVTRLGSAYAPPKLIRSISKRIGCKVVVGYGMTETGTLTLTALSDSLEVMGETVGRPVPGVVLGILDESGRTLPPGETGEIAIQGHSLFLGYLVGGGALRLRTARDSEGWFHTGEDGFIDDSGYLHFVGRRKEMINRGGMKVSPIEVEKLLLDHPKVKAVAVVGMPDERLGERGCAFIVPQPHQTVLLEEIVVFLKGRGIAAYKLPERLELVEELPVSANSKVMKEVLRRDIAAKIGWEMEQTNRRDE